MRLTAGSYRELHWHTADEWAFMEYGNARVTVLNPDGTMFIGDVGEGDVGVFPAGYPHSIQGLGPDGCQFLLVFNQGLFSEDNTFLISEWVGFCRHDEDEAAGHAHILREIDQLNGILRCSGRLPECMSNESRGDQEQ